MKPWCRHQTWSKTSLSVVDGDGSVYVPILKFIPIGFYNGNCSSVKNEVRYYNLSNVEVTRNHLTVTVRVPKRYSFRMFFHYMKASNRTSA